MPDTPTMRERLAKIVWASEIANSDYSDVPFEHINRPRHSGLKHSVYGTVDAILSELEKPTPEMVKVGATALLTAEGYDVEKLDHYDYPPVVEETEAEFLAGFAAAIRAAKETK